MSPATAGQLLDDLQRQAWDLATVLPERRHDRHMVATQNAAGHLAGWPRLAQMGLHALRAVPLSPGEQHNLALLIPVLERVAVRPVTGPVDPHVARMADLLGAVGDLLHDEPTAFGPDERNAFRYRDVRTTGHSRIECLPSRPIGEARHPFGRIYRRWRDRAESRTFALRVTPVIDRRAVMAWSA